MLVDGNSVLFRAFYATIYGRPMTTSQGVPTNAVFAFANMLNKAIELIKPDALMVAFDSKKQNFRHEIYADYKSGRKEAPEELVVQFSVVREYLDAMNICRYEQEGIEADDIIGSLVKKYPDWDIQIFSSDHDLLQLVDETTSMFLMKKGISEMEEVTPDSLMQWMGITPTQIIDLKGLMGDSSDNIPGVPKVGEKTALKLLADYDSVEGVLAHVDEIKGKLHDNLVEFADQARMSKVLATIKTDEEIALTVEQMSRKPIYEKQVAFFQKYEMNLMLKKLKENKVPQQTSLLLEESKEETVLCSKVDICPQALLHEGVAILLDTDSDSAYFANVCGIALADEKQSVYLTLDEMMQDQKLLIFLASDIHKIVWDVKTMLHWLERCPFTIRGMVYDVMIAAFLCDTTCNSFEKTLDVYGVELNTTLEKLYGKQTQRILPDMDQLVEYCTHKVSFINQVWQDMHIRLKEMEMQSLFYDLEIPLTSILFEMEKAGVCVDEMQLNMIAEEMKKRVDELNIKINSYSAIDVNVNSPKQLAEFLFDELKLPVNKKRSTSVEVLEKLLGTHPIIEDLMEYRKVQKLYSTYAEGLKKSIFPDGRIHTIYNQCVTQTGRLSSTAPNLQNISVRDEEGRKIRKSFIPSKKNVLLAADYSQIELRVLAHMAKEEKLIEAFNEGMDIHTKTAMELFEVTEKEVTSLHRRQAKAVNFGIVYGISDFGLSNQLQISKIEAQAFIDKYLESYPNISVYMSSVVEQCQQTGYVKTLLNRRREIKEIHDKNYMIREFGKRAAMNAPIQGTAADLIKLAMISIDKRIKEEKLESVMILQVHDELIFDVVLSEVEVMKKLVKEEMEKAMKLDVPLLVECKVGHSWYEAK